MKVELYMPTMQIITGQKETALNFGKCSVKVENDSKDFILYAIVKRANDIFKAKEYTTQKEFDGVVYYVVTKELTNKDLSKYGINAIEFVDITKL